MADKPEPAAERPAAERKARRRRAASIPAGGHPVDVHVGSRVRAGRIQAGRTQQWLAKQLNLTFQQVQKYERGTNRISCSMLSEIAAALQRPAEWFFEDGPAEGTAAAAPPAAASDRQRLTLELTSNFARITDEGLRAHIVGLVASMAGYEPPAEPRKRKR